MPGLTGARCEEGTAPMAPLAASDTRCDTALPSLVVHPTPWQTEFESIIRVDPIRVRRIRAGNRSPSLSLSCESQPQSVCLCVCVSVSTVVCVACWNVRGVGVSSEPSGLAVLTSTARRELPGASRISDQLTSVIRMDGMAAAARCTHSMRSCGAKRLHAAPVESSTPACLLVRFCFSSGCLCLPLARPAVTHNTPRLASISTHCTTRHT